jgi:hypothetical protein
MHKILIQHLRIWIYAGLASAVFVFSAKISFVFIGIISFANCFDPIHKQRI